MDRGFGQGAVMLAGLAARALGWSPETFWTSTPAELAASLGTEHSQDTPLGRDEIAALIERDRDE